MSGRSGGKARCSRENSKGLWEDGVAEPFGHEFRAEWLRPQCEQEWRGELREPLVVLNRRQQRSQRIGLLRSLCGLLFKKDACENVSRSERREFRVALWRDVAIWNRTGPEEMVSAILVVSRHEYCCGKVESNARSTTDSNRRQQRSQRVDLLRSLCSILFKRFSIPSA